MTNAVWVQAQEPVGNANFSTVIRNNLSGHFELTEDVDLNEPGEDGQSRSPWTPIGSESQPFNGTLDGNDHIVYGLNVKRNGIAGLFSTLINARVENLVLVQPCVMSSVNDHPAGAVAGKAFNTTINHCINRNGTVSTTGQSSDAGGVVGEAFNSTVSNNLNTGAVSTNGTQAHAGGVVGIASNSTVSTNLNTGEVSTTRQSSHAGGAAGRAESSSTVSTNLNIGTVSTSGTDADAGGAAGRAESSSTVSTNLNTGAVNTTGESSDAGGAVGDTNSSSVSNNLNTGEVSTTGQYADVGGAAGQAYTSTVSTNLNTGTVSTTGQSSDAGGAAGLATFSSTVSNNLNIGTVNTSRTDADAGGAVGRATFSTTVSNNLNIGAVTATDPGSSTNSGGVLSFDEVGIKRNSGLNLTLWADGNSNQFPILRGVNRAYRDLRRINGTQDGANLFPEALEEFADPGGSVNGSLFDQNIWNVLNGYLPFLKSISRQRAVEAGINCDLGGFACSEEISTEPPTGSCPEPIGNPVFQAYDNENQWLYVVHLSDVQGSDMALIRFREDLSPDERFGDCGVQTFSPIPGLIEPSVSAGQLVLEPGDDHLFLTVSSFGGEDKPVLLDFTLSGSGADRSVHSAFIGTDQSLNAMKVEGGRVYVTGEADRNSVLGWFQRLAINHEQLIRDSGVGHDLALSLSETPTHAFVTGMDNHQGEVFLRKFNLLAGWRETAFGENGQQLVAEAVSEYSQQSVLLHREWVYVATNTEEDSRLVIRRYNPENGVQDNSFDVSEETPEFNSYPSKYRFTDDLKRRSRVRLIANDEYLHVLKYDRSGHIFVATYDVRGNGQAVYRHTESPEFDNVADFGVAGMTGKLFLAYKKNLGGALTNSAIRVYEVPIPNLVVNYHDNVNDREGVSRAALGWGIGIGVSVTIAALVSTGIVGYYLKKRLSSCKLGCVAQLP